MCLVYCWLVGMTMSMTSTTLGISKQTVINIYNFIREECSAKLLSLPMEEKILGGEGQIVEFDESLMIKRKYDHGRQHQQHNEWVFRMYDRKARKGWIKFVRHRDQGTLIPIVNEFVGHGTMVHSDGWAVYNNFGEHGYTHRVVVHKENILDPITHVHTQGIEEYWGRVKRKLRQYMAVDCTWYHYTLMNVCGRRDTDCLQGMPSQI